MRNRRLARAAVTFTLPLAICASASISCATRQSVESLRRERTALEAENFQLRKDLTEARVRLQMTKEGASREAGPAPSSSVPPRENPMAPAAPVDDAAPRVVYSEPITPGEALPVKAPGGGGVVSGAGARMALARQRLDAKDPQGALEVFRGIAAGQPDDPLADDAQFGAGECYFAMGRYEEAIAEYRKVINSFPFGDQVPFAFLKIGFAHLALEQRDLALDNFRSVSEAYPGTEAATVARQQIAHLKASQR